jgi:hypothetical protein
MEQLELAVQTPADPERKRRRLLPVAVALVVMLGIGAVAVLVTRHSNSAPTGTGPPDAARLNVNKNLLEVNGRRIVLLGTTIYLVPFYTHEDGSPDVDLVRVTSAGMENLDGLLTRLSQEGFNTIRVPLSADAFGSTPQSMAKTAAQVGRIARTADAHGMYTVLSWWDATDIGAAFTTKYTASFPSMEAVAHELAPISRVVIEPFNEPNHVTLHEWENVMGATMRYWRTTLGYKGVILLDTMDWSWTFDPGAARRLQKLDVSLLGGADPQLAFANHRYATTNTCFCGTEEQDWTSKIERYVTSFPIVGGEYGNFSAQGPPQPAWVDQFFARLTDTSVPRGLNGIMTFVWHWIDDNTMTTESGSFTTFGQQVVNTVQRVHNSPLGNG